MRDSLTVSCAFLLLARAACAATAPDADVADLFSGAASFQDDAHITNDFIHEMKAVQVGKKVYAYYRTYAGLPYQNCNGSAAIGLAVSDDGGASFTPYDGGKPVLPMGAPGDWDDCYAIAPSVARGPDGVYYMAYEGMSHAGYVAGDIGLAASADGIHWLKRGVLLRHGGGWEAGNIGTPSIDYFNGRWYVFYHGDDGGGPTRGRECRGFASGPDLGHLTKHGPPVLCPTPGAWDGAVIGRGDVHQDGGSYYMVFEASRYDGCAAGNWGWGVATSPDLVHWAKYWGNPIRQGSPGCGSDLPTWFVTPQAAYVYFRGVRAGNTTTRVKLTGNLPGGSYRASCKACGLSGDTLGCVCRDEKGGDQNASLDVSPCSGLDIANADGRLRCSAPLPPGSYLDTCDQASCSFSGGALDCSCETTSGTSSRSSLAVSGCAGGADIANIDGRLRCSPR